MASLKHAMYRLALMTCVAGALACSEDLTEIVVVVDSDLTADELDSVAISVEGMGDRPPVVTDLSAQPLPLSLGLVHDGGPLGPIRVRAAGSLDGRPVVAAERSAVSFVRGKTRMLRLTLLRACLTNASACVASCSDGACLTPWNPDLGKVDASMPIRDAGHDSAPDDDSGMDDDAGFEDAGDAMTGDASDTGVDSGPPCVIEDGMCFPYTPANFDPATVQDIAVRNGELRIDCATAVLDTTPNAPNAPTTTGWCRDVPTMIEVMQDDGVPAIVVPVLSLTITGSGRLRLVGNKPVILAVFGDASIDGMIDASADGAIPGAGGNAYCSVGVGTAGLTQTTDGYGASGGTGGSLATLGGRGGRGDRGTLTAASMLEGNALNVPLRGGCQGGRGGQGTTVDGGNLGGAGGGALQIAAAGTLSIGGFVAAGGGGGSGGKRQEDGGGGGGSGGAVRLEALTVLVTAGAWITANGGGGGGASDYDSATTQAGGNAPTDTNNGGSGGAGDNRGGNGGNGAGRGTTAVNGEDGETGSLVPFPAPYGAGGGGGGGGAGFITVRDVTLTSACTFPGHFSPLPNTVCN